MYENLTFLPCDAFIRRRNDYKNFKLSGCQTAATEHRFRLFLVVQSLHKPFANVIETLS